MLLLLVTKINTGGLSDFACLNLPQMKFILILTKNDIYSPLIVTHVCLLLVIKLSIKNQDKERLCPKLGEDRFINDVTILSIVAGHWSH